ncbi:MAG: type IV pilus modification protein PilV [Proteobacteria bacterium]|nr:type IV pilus modification protein PilV [Pseudomonadota bacterium]
MKYRYLTKDRPHQLNGMVKSSGFSLLEVLISMVVLSIGLLGIAGLQATSKRTSYEALQRTTAVMLTRDIIERMRTNPDQIAAYSGTVDTTTITHNDCGAATCTPVQLAAYDLFEWQQAILGASELSDTGVNTGGLVSPVGCITVAAACTSCSVTVAIAWRGMTKLSDPSIDTCGNASGNYDDTAGDNVFRRVIAINSFITNN